MAAVDYHYTRTVSMSVPEAIAALEAALKEQNFGMLWHLDMQGEERLHEFAAGVERELMQVVDRVAG